MGIISFFIHTLSCYLMYSLSLNFPLPIPENKFLLCNRYILILGRSNAWATELGVILKLVIDIIDAVKLTCYIEMVDGTHITT